MDVVWSLSDGREVCIVARISASGRTYDCCGCSGRTDFVLQIQRGQLSKIAQIERVDAICSTRYRTLQQQRIVNLRADPSTQGHGAHRLEIRLRGERQYLEMGQNVFGQYSGCLRWVYAGLNGKSG